MINVYQDHVANTGSRDYPGNISGKDEDWTLDTFKKNFDIDISFLTDNEANFDLKGIDTSLANAFRRIMIAEVPSVAIDSVFIEMNTSVIQDEVLASRIGLVPLRLSPDWLDWVDPTQEAVDENGESQLNNSRNTVIFSLNVKCERNKNAPAGSEDPNELYINSNVYARDLKFQPQEGQLEFMDPPPTVASPDILLCKLRPGQEISLYCFAVLGVGSDHAKFSPVSTASYRLMPSIILAEDITGEEAEKLKKCFSPGVIDIKNNKAVVVDPRRDTVSREVLRHPEFRDKVQLGRVRNHFIFNVESTGAMEPDEIFVKSINQLRNKAKDLLACEL